MWGWVEELIIKKCAWAGVPIQSEVIHLFLQLIPQRGLSRMEKGRKRNAIIPVSSSKAGEQKKRDFFG